MKTQLKDQISYDLSIKFHTFQGQTIQTLRKRWPNYSSPCQMPCDLWTVAVEPLDKPQWWRAAGCSCNSANHMVLLFFFGMKISLERALIGYEDSRIVKVIYTENRIKMASLVSKKTRFKHCRFFCSSSLNDSD